MKLYTEDSMTNAINKAILNCVTYGVANINISKIIDSLTPIEIPSDEETRKESFVFMKNVSILLENVVGSYYNDINVSDCIRLGFIEGCEWVIDKIKNQIK